MLRSIASIKESLCELSREAVRSHWHTRIAIAFHVLEVLNKATLKAVVEFIFLMQYQGEKIICHSSVVRNEWLWQVNSGDIACKFTNSHVSSSIHCVSHFTGSPLWPDNHNGEFCENCRDKGLG